MADSASFWAGSSLGPIEIASARSFLRHGDLVRAVRPAGQAAGAQAVGAKAADATPPQDAAR